MICIEDRLSINFRDDLVDMEDRDRKQLRKLRKIKIQIGDRGRTLLAPMDRVAIDSVAVYSKWLGYLVRGSTARK